MDKIEDMYNRLIETRDIVEDYVDAYESMIMESCPDGDHESWLRYKGICEELMYDIEVVHKDFGCNKFERIGKGAFGGVYRRL